MGGLILLLVTFVLMWVLFILPQQRRVRAHQALVASLVEGDEIVTTSGIFGTITELDGETVMVEVAPGIELLMARGAIAGRANLPIADDEEHDGEDEDEGEVEATAFTDTDLEK